MSDKYYIPLKNYEEKYMISNYGTILNKETNQELKPQIKYKYTPYEYYVVILNYNGNIKKVPIHHLMAESFSLAGNGKYIEHIDGNNKNNKLDNLKLSNTKTKHNINHNKIYINDISTFKDIGYINNILYEYKINIDGIIINKHNIKLTPIKSNDGNDYIRLYNNGNQIKISINRLIGKVFLENGEQYFNDSNYIIKYTKIGDRKNFYWEKNNLKNEKT